MELQQLLRELDFHQVWPFLEPSIQSRLQKDMETGHSTSLGDLHKLESDYARIWEEILSMGSALVVDCEQLVVLEWKDDGEVYFNVAAFHEDNPKERYAMEFVPWEEWLSIPICEKSLRRYGRERFAAECLLEMTFCGLSNQAVKDRYTEIMRTLRESEERLASGAKTFSLDEIEDKWAKEFGWKPPSPEEKAACQVLMEQEWRENMALWSELTGDQ